MSKDVIIGIIVGAGALILQIFLVLWCRHIINRIRSKNAA